MKLTTRVICLSVAVWTLAGVCHAAPLYSKDVFCGDEKCGTMEIDTYGNEDKVNTALASNKWLGRVEIEGQFVPLKGVTFHYIQAVKDEADSFRWINDATVALPQPYLDPPPGGYKAKPASDGGYTSNQAFDFLPYYDEGEFPDFYDRPGEYLLPAKTDGNKKLEQEFETWLVCVIEEKFGPNANQAKDDSYTVAPLIGWEWGFDITYADAGVIGTDEPGDFTVTKRPFNWLAVPTALWTGALSAKYGAAGGGNQDYWDITTGACENCIPEPSTGCLLLLGLAIVTCRRRGRGDV